MRLIILSFLILLLFSCTKTEVKDSELPSTKQEAMDVYKDALSSMDEGQYLIASEKFDQSESLLPQTEWAAKASLLAAFYGSFNRQYGIIYYIAYKTLERLYKIAPCYLK